MPDYDIIIIGAGPAGLFCSLELSRIAPKLKTLVIDEGREAINRACPMNHKTNPSLTCKKCAPCNIMSGVGGAGGLSDGKLNLSYKIGGDLTEFVQKEEAEELIDYVDKVFLDSGGPSEMSGNNGTDELLVRAAKAGIRYVPVTQRHIGSDRLPEIIHRIKTGIEKKGAKFLLSTKVLSIEDTGKEKKITIRSNDKESALSCKYLVLAVGRSGAHWFQKQANALGISAVHAPIDVGVRVEVQNSIMERVTKINWDPKFIIHTDKYDDQIRTFCTCPSGFVTREDYGTYVGVNGHSMFKEKSLNTNFAFLSTVRLTEPVENTSEYGKSIATMATKIGGGNPIIQRLRDLRNGKRSTWERIGKSYVTPTLKTVTPGDISMALPHRVVMNIIQGLEKLDKVIPGVAEDGTLLYAPEIKFYAMRASVKEGMETSIENVFAAGDGAGLSRDIVNAAATGVIAARGIISKQN
ncbi:MAG: NAD(P)/FAD-dependent oxidoreductase [Candidatus Aenigmarchaeota archaeon]|nr:NAD(P)/FAD-dependent oxidoreductase [Candidatus Aenigmarchaeota archaeon]